MVSNVSRTSSNAKSISINNTSTTVVGSDGNVYQAGLLNQHVKSYFTEIASNIDITGQTLDAVSVVSGTYILNKEGYVFFYNNTEFCRGNRLCEVYTPTVCDSDRAVSIKAGRDHVIILTELHHIWGAGDNTEYQLVPQGQARYNTAVKIFISDYIKHNNRSDDACERFTGKLTLLNTPIYPQSEICTEPICISDSLKKVLLGDINIAFKYTPCGGSACNANILFNIYGDVDYSGIICTKKNSVTGSLTVSITNVCISKTDGCETSKYLCPDAQPVDFSYVIPADICCSSLGAGITNTINSVCGESVQVSLEQQLNALIVDPVFINCIVTDLNNNCLLVPINGTLIVANPPLITTNISNTFDIIYPCCTNKKPIVITQPCWKHIYAGSDNSVFVDDCNRIYVLGSLHKIRNNCSLLKKSCLEELFEDTVATITMPANQLNCSSKKNSCSMCPDKPDKFCTDLNKIGVQLTFANGSPCDGVVSDLNKGRNCGKSTYSNDPVCSDDCTKVKTKNTNVCDFLRKLKDCNDTPDCSISCEPCDNYIYLHLFGLTVNLVNSITLWNRKSVCRVSSNYADTISIVVGSDSVIDLTSTHYCIDGVDYSLDRVIILELESITSGNNVDLYMDLDCTPRGIQFTSCYKPDGTLFNLYQSDDNKYILNYGSTMDGQELNNLKIPLTGECGFVCREYKNPPGVRLINTYLQPGDHVEFISNNSSHAITSDLPTVFVLNRRILDIAVGDNNLSVLAGGSVCANEIYVIGKNCYGELGNGSIRNIVCWSQVNRCLFDSQVYRVYAGYNSTFYVTQTGKVYASGQWRGLFDSTKPTHINKLDSVCGIRSIVASVNHLVALGVDGCVYGMGLNQLGQLGAGHCKCVQCVIQLQINKSQYCSVQYKHQDEHNVCKEQVIYYKPSADTTLKQKESRGTIAFKNRTYSSNNRICCK